MRRNPLWKQRRLEIIRKANYTCVSCQSTETEKGWLEVHHTTYARGLFLWEYPDETLLCLCRGCHEERQIVEDEARFEFGRMLGRMSEVEVAMLAKHLRALANHGITIDP